jgi:formamidopyrimidine-DNA glycosylase
VPELPEVEQVRRELAPYLEGARVNDVELRRANLRTPFPPGFRDRLIGQTVRTLERRAKYLLASLSSGETLVMHLGMTGEFKVEVGRPAAGAGDPEAADRVRPPADRHDHVIFSLASGTRVTFNDARRFGFMDLVAAGALDTHPSLGGLGPEPLSDAFDGAALARALRGKRTAIKVALLDQRVVAGIGNIYASEALHAARLSPFRKAGTLATPAGAPRESAIRLAAAIRQVLQQAIARTARGAYRGSRFRVYDRAGTPCPRRDCGGTIRRRTQAGRSTFWCPACQK